jgi:5-hydroxyisourate hydrolase-like protein (transthyretin family)
MGFATLRRTADETLSGLAGLSTFKPRVARTSQPWAERCNPFGIAKLAILALVWLACVPASGLIMTGRGNQAVADAGWPEGALAMANFESRIGWWEGPPFGGGEWHFLYQGNTEGFKDALATFSAIRAPALDLVIHDGPYGDSILKEKVDWAFTVWVPASWHHLYNNPKSTFSADDPRFRRPVDPPRLDVYVGGDAGVDWVKVKVPAGVTVRDERAAPAPIRPDGGAVLRADIFDMASGKPVAGARVTVARYSGAGQGPSAAYEKVAEAVSDAGGHVEIPKIPAGTYRVTAGTDGYATRVLGYERFGARTFKQFTVELAKSAVLQGNAADTDGKPLKGVKVYASSVMALDGRGYGGHEELSTDTDAEGRFELRGLPVGYVQLGARAQGYHFSDLFTIHEVPATNVLLHLGSAGAIHGSVTDHDGRALSRYESHEILINIEPKGGSKAGSWGGGATVKDDGTFEFNNVPPGEYRISSRPNPSSSNRQYAPEQIIDLKAGARAEVKVVYE